LGTYYGGEVMNSLMGLCDFNKTYFCSGKTLSNTGFASPSAFQQLSVDFLRIFVKLNSDGTRNFAS
jgi:hypothetical protein